MKNLIICIIILTGLCNSAFAQDKSNREIKADKHYFLYSFDKAIRYYNRTNQLTVEGQRRLAESYYNTELYILSEEAYKNLLDNSTDVIPEDHFKYAMLLKMNGKNEASNVAMDKFVTLRPNDLRALDYKANKKDYAYISKDKGQYKIHNLDISNSDEDFAPAFYDNKIVFASSRTKQGMIVRNSNWTGNSYYDLYVSELDENQLEEPKLFNKGMSGRLHDGPASFNKNGTYMAFTKNNYGTSRSEKVVQLEIHFSHKVDEKWSEAEAFHFNNDNYSVGHPSLTADGNTMYFTSDVPGGYGGSDIYRVSRNANGTWGTPVNMGNKINTEGDEMFPFIHEKSNTLYFSSNGRYGLGGFDIFTGELQGLEVSNVKNAGAPLNSKYDDYGVIINERSKMGFFSSNRSGESGSDNIYAFEIFEIEEEIEEEVIIIAEVIDDEEENITHTPVAEKSDDKPITLNFEASSIYFDFDKSNIRRDAAAQLDKIIKVLNDNPTMKLRLSSHTDCYGTSAYNQNLSNQRSAAALNYIKKGITNPSRVTGSGYGKSKLVNDCECTNEADSNCNDRQHQNNRRTDFVIQY